MKLIKTLEAEGHVLCHDMTMIIKDKYKDAYFRKGHIVTKEDIPILLSMGKEQLYVWEKAEGMLHEDEAAERLFTLCNNEHISRSGTKEGKIDAYSDVDGVFKVDRERLQKINEIGEIIISTRHGDFPVHKGDKLAGMRVIPLVIEEEKLKRAEELTGGRPLFQLMPFTAMRAAIVTTGNEVYHGRIQDKFGPVICDKLKEYNIDVTGQKIIDDNPVNITEAILEFIEAGADIVICTGGMSVDPDDTTPSAIKATGAELISYGAPVLPGAMFLLAYFTKGDKTVPVIGLPGCVMYNKRTIFDLVLPRVAANDRITRKELTDMGEGGLCLSCENCTFPNCSFGK